jgi:Zn-dependent alcohol dehydrogenase
MSRASRAAVHRIGSQNLDLTTVEVADPGPGTVLVRMGASGVCPR